MSDMLKITAESGWSVIAPIKSVRKALTEYDATQAKADEHTSSIVGKLTEYDAAIIKDKDIRKQVFLEAAEMCEKQASNLRERKAYFAESGADDCATILKEKAEEEDA